MLKSLIFLVVLLELSSLDVEATSYASSSTIPTINPLILKKNFNAVRPFNELVHAFYSVNGLSLLGEKQTPESESEICNFVKSKIDKTSLESIYYSLSLTVANSKCDLPMMAELKSKVATTGATTKNMADLYYYTMINLLLKNKIDSKTLAKSVTESLKADSSILNQAYSLHIASELTEGQKVFYDSIEDILEQADEVDDKYLQYEGGVGTTSFLLEGIFKLSEKMKQFPSDKLTNEKLIKFVNYLTSKRAPINIKSAYFLTNLALKLSDNKFCVPVLINRLSPISSNNLIVGVSNIMGSPLKQKFKLEGEAVKNDKAESLFVGKKEFVSKSNDGSLFELKIDSSKATANFYTIQVSLAPKSSQHILLQDKLTLKVSTKVVVKDLQIGVADRDQSSPRLTSLEPMKLLPNRLDADTQMKFYLRFNLNDVTSSKSIEAHQVFVRFTHVKSGKVIIFLGQSTPSTKQYNADVDFLSNAKNFVYNNGVYAVELVVSDPLIENSIQWKLGEIKLTFGNEDINTATLTAATSSNKALLYNKKPEIQHLFRLPEPMPSKSVSAIFAALCAAPLGLLIILWLSIGFNFSKFSFSLSGLVFHGALAGNLTKILYKSFIFIN
jgi:oligosaccharyltransferase complex subunit delta (ribophorin II)